MARPKISDDATKRLKPEDETQVAPKGTKVGLLPKSEIGRNEPQKDEGPPKPVTRPAGLRGPFPPQ